MKSIVFIWITAILAPAILPAQNRFEGSVASGAATANRLPLSLADAISRGMKTNLGALVAAQDVRTAQGARGLAMSRLLPNITAGISETSEQINLAAFGFKNFPGIAEIVGPFGLTDGRAYLTQPNVNLK